MRITSYRPIMAAVLAGVLWAVSFAGAQRLGSPDVALEAAAKKEMVDGDLKGAIELYEKIIAQYGATDRAAAARALLRMGQCYERLGVKEVAEARKAYQRVVREFSDQKDVVATAQVRLVALGSERSSITYRQAWAGPKVDTSGAISPDGRYLSYVDRDTWDLALHDFSTGSNRRLTNTRQRWEEFAEASAISRDGKQVVYNWRNADHRWVLRIVNLETAGFTQPRDLFGSEDVDWIEPHDWSPDGKWIAVGLGRKGGQVGLVATQDGSLRVLKSDGSDPHGMSFSPDGKYLGVDLSIRENTERDVSVLALDGSGETKVIVNPGQDILMGWSPDGKRLLFASDRTGSMALWALPVADGKPTGPPELIRSEIAPRSLGVTTSGALYVGATLSTRNIQVASLDFDTGKLVAPPVSPPQSFIGSNTQPDWSPDGKYLAYVSKRNSANTTGPGEVLVIRSVETGKTRDLRPNLRFVFLPRWAPDSRSFVTQGGDFQDRWGIYRIDATTGEASPIVTGPTNSPFRFPQWSPDGKKIYYVRPSSEEMALVERDLAAGSERELVRGWVGIPCVLPDGRHVAWTSFGPDKSEAVLLVPLAGGEPLELLRTKGSESVTMALTSTPDGRGLLVQKRLSSGGSELLLVPVGGGQPRKLDDRINSLPAQIRIHPDGRQIAWAAGESKQEVWVLENFLPAK